MTGVTRSSLACDKPSENNVSKSIIDKAVQTDRQDRRNDSSNQQQQTTTTQTTPANNKTPQRGGGKSGRPIPADGTTPDRRRRRGGCRAEDSGRPRWMGQICSRQTSRNRCKTDQPDLADATTAKRSKLSRKLRDSNRISVFADLHGSPARAQQSIWELAADSPARP